MKKVTTDRAVAAIQTALATAVAEGDLDTLASIYSTLCASPADEVFVVAADKEASGVYCDGRQMRRVKVDYDAAGGFLHRWVQGTGSFTMAVEQRASAADVQCAAEAEAAERARRRCDHWNAVVSDVRWQEVR